MIELTFPQILMLCGAIILGIAVLGVIAFVNYLKSNARFKEANESLGTGRLAEALAAFKREAAASCAPRTEFKLTGWEKSAYEKALEGIAQVYAAAGMSVDLSTLEAIAEEAKQRKKQMRWESSPEDAEADLARMREEARFFLEQLPAIGAGQPTNPPPAAAPATATAPATVRVACQCGQQFDAAAALRGTTQACPSCGAPLAIP